MAEQKTRYYESFSDDFVTTENQNYELKSDYEWIKTDTKSKILSFLTYSLALIIGSVYCYIFLGLRIKNKKVLKQQKGGCFIFANHTQPFGDVVMPAFCAFPKRIYTLCSPSNFGLKFIGRFLTYLGALPIPNNISGMGKLSKAIEKRVNDGNCVVIYPEAHVWEYCSFIRPYSDTSFLYPVKYNRPSFCVTTVYKKRRISKKPKTILYIDGPYYPDKNLPRREQIGSLYNEIYNQMKKRATESDCEYIKYEKK